MANKHSEDERRIRAALSTALRFWRKHRKPRTNSDWDGIAVSLSQYRDPLANDLVIAIADDLEREYLHATKEPLCKNIMYCIQEEKSA